MNELKFVFINLLSHIGHESGILFCVRGLGRRTQHVALKCAVIPNLLRGYDIK